MSLPNVFEQVEEAAPTRHSRREDAERRLSDDVLKAAENYLAWRSRAVSVFESTGAGR